MTLKTFLSESVSYNDIIKAIKSNNLTGRLLWRGMKETGEEFGIKKTRKDRRSLSNYPYHDEFNKAFKEKFGVKLRSETLFVTKDNSSAGTFGTPYVIIPKDKPKYYYSPKVKDLFAYDQKYFENGVNGTFEEKMKNIVDSYIETSDISKIKYDYSDGEIMLLCDEYYYIDMENMSYDAWENYEGLLQYLEHFNV